LKIKNKNALVQPFASSHLQWGGDTPPMGTPIPTNFPSHTLSPRRPLDPLHFSVTSHSAVDVSPWSADLSRGNCCC